MRTFFILLLAIAFHFNTNAQEKQQVYYTNLNVLKRLTSTDSVRYSYEVYQLTNMTYGYVIFADGEKYLHQPNMPGKDMNTGFGSRSDAEKVAEIVIEKLRYPVLPADVSTVEMQYWGIK